MTPAIDKALLINTIQKEFTNTIALYAFGSRIQGNATPHSDLDLAVLVAGYADPLKLWDASNTLANQLGFEVDLLDMRVASTVMQYQIIMNGLCLWGKQPQTALFECFILSEKTELDSARSALLTDIQQQGSVYGR